MRVVFKIRYRRIPMERRNVYMLDKALNGLEAAFELRVR